MKNKSLNFGYVGEYDMINKLKVNDYLRGCNAINGEDVSDYYDHESLPPYLIQALPSTENLELPTGLKSFMYRRLALDCNPEFEKFVYSHLLINSFCSQIHDNIVRDGLVFCNFDKLENEDIEDLTDLVDYFNQVLEFRGYRTDVINGELLVLNISKDMELSSLNEIVSSFHKTQITVYIKDLFVYKEEDLYRASSELLRLLPNYRAIEDLWRDCKGKIEILDNLEFNSRFELAYNALLVYAFLNPLNKQFNNWYEYEEYSPMNMGNVVKNIHPNKKSKVEGLIEDLVSTEFLLNETDEYGLGLGCDIIGESILIMEEIIDNAFTPELKIFKSLNISEYDIEYLCYYLVKTHAPLREAITLDHLYKFNNTEVAYTEEDEPLDNTQVEGEYSITREVVGSRKGFKKYLPYIAILLVILSIISGMTLI